MAKANGRSGDSIHASFELVWGDHAGRAGARRRTTLQQQVDCPLNLLRAVRALRALATAGCESIEFWKRACFDIDLRCAAVDPAMRTMTPEDLTRSGMLRCDEGSESEVRGVIQAEPSDPREAELAEAVGKIRRAVLGWGEKGRPTTTQLATLDRAADALQRAIADPDTVLSEREQAVWDLLLQQSEDRPLTSPKILAALRKTRAGVSPDLLRRHLSGILARKGVRNRLRRGYFIPREFRPPIAGR